MNPGPMGNEPKRERSADGWRVVSECTDRPRARTAESRSHERIEDRTAGEVFAELRASCSEPDADGVLGEDSPEKIIQRAEEPVEEPAIDDDLFDQAAFEALVLPDRRRDGEFLWIEIDEADAATAPASTTAETASGSTEPSDPVGTTLGDGPNLDHERVDALEEAIATFRSVRSNGEPADRPSSADATDRPSSADATDHPSNRDATDRPAVDPGSNRADSVAGNESEDHRRGTASSNRSSADDSSDSSPVSNESTGATDQSKSTVSTTVTGTRGSFGSGNSAESEPSRSANRPSWITGDVDDVSSPDSGKVPTREPTANGSGSRRGENDGEDGSTMDLPFGPPDAREDGARDSSPETVGDDAISLEDDPSEIRTHLVRFEHKREAERGALASVRRGLGRFVSGFRGTE